MMAEIKYKFNNEYLRNMVQEIVDEFKLKNVVVKHKTGVAKGSGYLSQLHRFVVEGKRFDETKQLHIIAKTKPQLDHEVSFMDAFWEVELLMYEHVLPEYEKVQNNLNTKLLWPRCYGVRREGKMMIILLEDLSSKGYDMCRLGRSLDFEHAKLALEQLACLHANSFVFENRNPELFQNFLEERNQIVRFFEFMDYMDPSIEFAANNIDDEEFQRVLKKFRDFDFKNKVRHLMDGRNYKHAVISHGDVWANNLLFQYEKEKPKSAVLLDYQISSYSSPLCDLYYALFLAVDETTREKFFMDLVDIYYKALQRQIIDLGEDPEIIYSNKQFQRDLRIFSFTGMAQTLLMLPIFANEAEKVEASQRQEMVPGETFFGVPIASPLYVSRVLQMAKDINKHGLDALWSC